MNKRILWFLVVSLGLVTMLGASVIHAETENEGDTEDRPITQPTTPVVNINRVPRTPTVTPPSSPTVTVPAIVDSDGDGVPDSVDLHPGQDDAMWLRDSDGDGVVDAEDKHPGEPDSIYAVTDKNNNGIVDNFEQTFRKGRSDD